MVYENNAIVEHAPGSAAFTACGERLVLGLAAPVGPFVMAGVLSHPAGKTTIKLAAPERERAWRRRLWEKLLSPFPNYNAVENHPVFTCHSL